MNIQNLLQMASNLGIGQDKINQAQKMMSNYSSDMSGLRKVINDNGGTDFLNKAIQFSNNPLVKVALRKVGVTDELIESVKKDLGIAPAQNSDNFLDRFKNLK